MILKLRSVLFWTHLVVGVVAGLFILNMAVSGIFIAYERQITAFAEQSQRTVTAPQGATHLDIEDLSAAVQKARPDAVLAGVVVYSDPSSAAMFNVGRDGVLFANPYNGEVLGDGQKSVRGFFQFMTGWHRWLAMEGTMRPVGQSITGIVSLSYFALLCSGLCLWIPRQWSRNALRQGTVLNWKLKGRARDWNWHNVVGIWCAPLLLMVTLTGIIMSYNWAADLLFRATGNPPPERRDASAATRGRTLSQTPDLTGLNPLWIIAMDKVPGWQSITLRFSPSPSAPVNFTIDRGNDGRPDQMAQLSLDRDTGDVVRWQPYATQNAGQQLRSWVRPLHTGQAGGFLGQTIAVVAALGGITLVCTGLLMAFRRFFGNAKLTPDLLS